MKVLDTRVLLTVEKAETPETKIGSIVIKDSAPEYEKATIISVGEKVCGVSEGDFVLIYPGSGKKIKVDGKEYRVISSSEIIVVL